MKQFFTKLLDYGHYFNQKLGDVFIENAEKTSEKSRKLFSHILNAHQIWNNRIALKQAPFEVWQNNSVHGFKNIDKINCEHSLFILDCVNLDDKIDYTNSRGQTFNNSIRDILFHIINHSTYHRGQIAADFRQSGLDPLITDYIFYKR